jgi:hypothetical protein
MTYFHVEMNLTCPSDWDEAKCRRYIERFVVTDEERSTISILTPADYAKPPLLTSPGSWTAKARAALWQIQNIQSQIPWNGADAANECIRIAKEALGEKV